MCSAPLIVNAAGRLDPTRTTGIRAAFVRDVRKRWNALKRDIRKTIVDQDAFNIAGAMQMAANAAAGAKAFDFPRNADKVAAFMRWLEDQQSRGLLQVYYRPGSRLSAEDAWSNVYIRSAYQRGIARARAKLQQAGYSVPNIDSVPGGISGLMNTGFHADRVGLIYTRTFEDLKTVAQITNGRIRRILSDGLTNELSIGMAEGRAPKVIARNILKNVEYAVDHIGKVRSEMIARTEVIRAHTQATIVEYRQAAGDIEVEVEAEVLTAGDGKVCPICQKLADRGPMSLDVAGTLVPAHPNCRCALKPVIKRAEEAGQQIEMGLREAA